MIHLGSSGCGQGSTRLQARWPQGGVPASRCRAQLPLLQAQPDGSESGGQCPSVLASVTSQLHAAGEFGVHRARVWLFPSVSVPRFSQAG